MNHAQRKDLAWSCAFLIGDFLFRFGKNFRSQFLNKASRSSFILAEHFHCSEFLRTNTRCLRGYVRKEQRELTPTQSINHVAFRPQEDNTTAACDVIVASMDFRLHFIVPRKTHKCLARM